MQCELCSNVGILFCKKIHLHLYGAGVIYLGALWACLKKGENGNKMRNIRNIIIKTRNNAFILNVIHLKLSIFLIMVTMCALYQLAELSMEQSKLLNSSNWYFFIN